MIKLNTPTDDDSVLDQSRLLHALRQTILYADEHGGIGLTQTKAFNRKFAHWAAANFDWPEYSTDRLLSIQKVLNEWDVPPVAVIHDVLTIAKWGRHTKGVFKLSKSLTTLNTSRGKLFVALVEHFLFRYNHNRFSRSDFTAPGNWQTFLNIINVEAQDGLTEAHLVKTLYSIKPTTDPFDRDFQNHKWFLVSNVLRPLTWIGFLVETRASDDRLAERIYWKTPLWSKCLLLETDHYLEHRTTH